VVYRACSEDCTRGYRVTVATADALHAAPVRRVRAAMFLALPIAVLIGAVAGRHVVRRLLRPLQELTQAASRLRTRPGPRLGVGARPLELAALEASFDALLTDLGQMLARERRFAQDASHELRTPLTALSLRLEELAGRLRADTDAGSEVRKAQASVAELDRLVEALLLLARSEAAEVPMVPVNVCDVVRDVARRQADADVGASPAPEVEAPDEILIRGVEELLTHALANVTENARKYAGPGARIRLGVRRDGPWAVTTVEDDGPGIPAELRSRVFERFFRAPEQRVRCSGAGLGLPVTRAIVDRHGGSVDLDRGVLGGLAVHLRLPLCE
jgi:signal transduction histidine kinase